MPSEELQILDIQFRFSDVGRKIGRISSIITFKLKTADG
jgi:hypothetical protein